MAITDAEFLAAIIDRLRLTASLAFLHGEGAAASGQLTSDADLVADRPSRSLIGDAKRELEGIARLVLVFPYDTGAESYFFIGPRNEGAQIDLMYDPDGRGRLGLRTGELLRGAEHGARWARLNPVDLAIYTFLKRAMKHDPRRALVALRELEQDPVATRDRAVEICVPRTRRVVEIALQARSVPELPIPRRHPRRIFDRVLRPVGASISFSGSEGPRAAADLETKLAPILPEVVRTEARPGRSAMLTELTRRYRPAVSVSASSEPGSLRSAILRRTTLEASAGASAALDLLERRAWKAVES